MKNQILVVLVTIATLAISPMASVFAASNDALEIDKAVVDTSSDEVNAILKAHGHISTNGKDGAFGYGILTDKGLSAVIVSTTHKGVLDSAEQNGKNDPVWHNHFVTLKANSDECGDDLKVKKITYQSPGDVNIKGKVASLTNIPDRFTGTDALSNKKLTLTPGTDVDDVVSFELSPQFDGNKLTAVCVTNIQSADDVIVN